MLTALPQPAGSEGPEEGGGGVHCREPLSLGRHSKTFADHRGSEPGTKLWTWRRLGWGWPPCPCQLTIGHGLPWEWTWPWVRQSLESSHLLSGQFLPSREVSWALRSCPQRDFTAREEDGSERADTAVTCPSTSTRGCNLGKCAVGIERNIAHG